MKRKFLWGLILVFVAAPLSGWASSDASTLQTKIDRYMNAAVKVDHFMGSVLVARNGEVIVAKGYGMANLEKRIPNTPGTEFRIGSVTKQFTAMAILMLQAKGKLNVKDPICKYVPQCPKDWQPITIYELLTHTSGIPNFTSFPNYKELQKRQTTPTHLLDDFKSKPLDFEPGTQFKYSNSGYQVLGYIIQNVSGESYQKFLRQHIFVPLGMKHSGYDSSHPTEKDHAIGYAPTGSGYRPAEYVNMSVPYSAGALYSTVLDLYTWDQALEAGKLLPEPLLKQLFTPHVAMDKSGRLHYGFGWMTTRQFGHEKYFHNGGIQGFTAVNSWFPGQQAYVIVLDNVSAPNVGGIANGLTAILFGKQYRIPKAHQAIKLSPDELQKFVGVYQLAPDFDIAVTLGGDQLKAQATNQPAFPIYPEAKTEFFLKAVDAQVSFVTDAKGRVTGLVLHQGGQDIPGKKIR